MTFANPVMSVRKVLGSALLLGGGIFCAQEALGAELRSLQSGTTTIGAGSASATATLSPGVDTTRAFLVFGVSENTNSPNDGQVSGQITGSTTLTFARIGATGAVTVKWYVAEFASGVSVQRGSVQLPGAPNPADTPVTLGTAVNLAKSFPIISFRTDGGAFDSGDFIRAKLTTTTNLQLFAPDAGLTAFVEWQVVEYTDANVQTGDVSFAFGETSKTATLSPEVDTYKSWLLYTYECAPAFCNGDVPNIGSKLLRGVVSNGTTLTFDRNNPGIAGETINLTWYLVEFTDRTIVRHSSEAFAAAETQRDVAIPSVYPCASLAAAGDYTRGGRSPYNADDVAGVAWFTLDVTGPTNLRVTRGAGGLAAADVGWFVVSFDSDRPCSTGGSWWNPSWGRRRRISFNNSGQAENLVNFPVLIKLDSSRIDYARTQNAGQDLRFVDANDQTVLDHEIEEWNEAGTSYVWVRVPQINASSTNDYIYVYYDNAGAPDGQNPTGVWSNGYQGVWHLKENPAGPPPQFLDSTANPNDGTAQNSPVQAAGQIDGSLSFDGTSDRNVNVPDNASLRLPTNMTVSGWARTTSADGQARLVVAKWNATGRNYWLGKLNASTFNFYVDNNTENVGISLSLINDGAWHHVVGVADASGGLLRLYVDGTQRATAAYDGTSQTGTSVLQIGNNPDSTGQNWDGGIDEVRVANVARSAAWIRAQYLSTSDGFAAFGPEVGACQLRSIGTAANYTAGTVTATNGSWLVTGSGTTWRTANRGRGDRITIDGTDYTILAVASDTELRLSSVFTGTSGSGKAHTIARKFTTLQAWEDCVSFAAACPGVASASLVADNREEVGIAYEDSVFALTADVTINGSTTDRAHRITLTADGPNRHNGTPGAGMVVDGQNGPNEIVIQDSNVTLEWLEFIRVRGADFQAAVRILAGASGPTNVVVQNVLIHDFDDPGFAVSGIRLSGVGGKSATIRNCMIWDGDRYGIEADEATDTLVIENCSIDQMTGTGIDAQASALTVRNTIVTSSPTADFAAGTGSFSGSNNTSSDGSAPGANAQTLVPAANIYVTPNADLHLKAGANAQVDTGLDLSCRFLIDIDNQLRPAGAWDRGADERDATTAVELASFGACGLDSAVELRWQTASELRNLGFHLYRSSSEAGPYERITSSLIPGLGSSPTGASYSYLDSGLSNGATYFYKLEDVETTGKTEMHGPVSATPQAGIMSGTAPGQDDSAQAPSGSSPSRITYGDPSAVSLRLLERGSHQVVLELTTGGFYAVPQADGSVRLEIPGFEDRSQPGSPALPTRLAWVEATVGRRVRLASVRATDVTAFALRPTAASAPVMLVDPDGTVRAGRKRQNESAAFHRNGLYPEEAARILDVAFQGETKRALLELAPLRWDGRSTQLLLARRLIVHVVFEGREPGERSLGRSRGRRDHERATDSSREVFARLLTRGKGLYTVSFEEVFGSRGRALRASEIRLSHQGQAVAFHIEPDNGRFAPGSVLYFVSPGASVNPYGDSAVYELERGQAGVAMPVGSASPWGGTTPYCFQTRQWETNRTYQAGLTDAPDIWLWDALVSRVTKSYSFTLTSLAPSTEPARLTVKLQGASDFDASPDHHLRAYVNGILVGETSWDGKTPQSLEADVASGILREGDNQLQIENVGDTGAAYSLVFLNRFTLTYPRRLAAEGGALEGTWTASGTAEVAGLAAGSVVLDTTAEPQLWLRGGVVTPTGLSFRAEGGRSYLAVGEGAVLKPEIRRPTPSSLKRTTNRADYLLIAPGAFLTAAEPLLEQRRSEGLAAQAVPIEQVYDEFGYGEPRPEALRDFLAYAYHHWQAPSVRYVVLLGDATYDFKNFLGTGVLNRVPPFMVKTSYLWTASDPSYAAINGEDGLPDLAIGRLPASSVEEAQRLVDKILTWEAAGENLSGRAVLVADNGDKAGDFEADAEQIAALLAPREVERIYLSQLGSATRSSILSAFDQGASLMSYIGHGGIAVWATENIFNNLDVASLAPQAQQPLVLTLNCLNGYFHFPSLNSLAEEMVKAEGKGAIAAFSPSGLSLNDAAHAYHQALLREIVSGRHTTLGDALLAAQAAYADSGALPELLAIYHLLGDPALRLR